MNRPDDQNVSPTFVRNMYNVLPTLKDSRFRLVGQLQGGGMGRIFKAEDVEFGGAGRDIVVKLCDSRDPLHVRQFRFEGDITARLGHPGVLPVYGRGTTAGRPYYAMKTAPGKDLSLPIKALHAGGDPAAALPDLLRKFVFVCRTVQFAHDRGLVHRDLKPANILLGEHGETWIADWGLAWPMDPALQREAGIAAARPLPGGTKGYSSPEQRDNKTPGTPDDVYSLGAVLHTILTGREYDAGTSVKDVSVPRVRALRAVCDKAKAEKPEDRYKSAEELAKDIERWLADEPVAAYPENPWERFARWRRNHRTLVRVGVASLALVAGIAFAAERITSAALGREQIAKGDADNRSHSRLLALIDVAERRGDWKTCVERLDEAIAAGRGYTGGLHIRRLRALLASGHGGLMPEMKRLLAEEELQDSDVAALRLLLGDQHCTSKMEYEAGRDLVRKALDSGTLSDADTKYARAFLTDRDDERINGFRAALLADGFHHRARSALSLNLFVAMRFDECSFELERAGWSFPDDANFKLLGVLLEPFRSGPLPTDVDASAEGTDRRMAAIHHGSHNLAVSESKARELLDHARAAAKAFRSDDGMLEVEQGSKAYSIKLWTALRSHPFSGTPLPPSTVYGMEHIERASAAFAAVHPNLPSEEDRLAIQAWISAASRYGCDAWVRMMEFVADTRVVSSEAGEDHAGLYRNVAAQSDRLRRFAQASRASMPGPARSAAASAVLCDLLMLATAARYRLAIPSGERQELRARVVRESPGLASHPRFASGLLWQITGTRGFDIMEPEDARFIFLSWRLQHPTRVQPLVLLARAEARAGNKELAADYAGQVLCHCSGRWYEPEIRELLSK